MQDICLQTGDERFFTGFHKKVLAFTHHLVNEVKEISPQGAHAGQEAVAGLEMELAGEGTGPGGSAKNAGRFPLGVNVRPVFLARIHQKQVNLDMLGQRGEHF